VAVDALHNVEFSFPAEVVDRMVKRFEDDFVGAWERFMTGFFQDPNSEVLKSILQDSDEPDPMAAIALLRDFNRFDAKAALTAAAVPVRAINATNPFPTAVEINRKYGDFDAVLLPDQGHFLMLEKPDEFNRQLRAIVEQFRQE
jgi:pimeloyl-ACP methyl ester carboxylesterase